MKGFYSGLYILISIFFCTNSYSKTSVNYLPICDPVFEECGGGIKPQAYQPRKPVYRAKKPVYKPRPVPVQKRKVQSSGRKIALIIGNQAYKNTSALKNPINDATAIARRLQQLGFKVTLLKDISKDKFKNTLYNFGRSATSAKIALIFYAGHALQINGKNYLLPTDAPNMADEGDIYELINVKNDIMNQISQAKVGIVILDACRNNPLSKNIPRSIRGRSVSTTRGLARVGQTVGNTLVAYATKPGEIAQDGKNNHSPFTQALLANLNKPVDIRRLFGMIRTTVLKLTHNQQDPEITVSLDGPIIILAK